MRARSIALTVLIGVVIVGASASAWLPSVSRRLPLIGQPVKQEISAPSSIYVPTLQEVDQQLQVDNQQLREENQALKQQIAGDQARERALYAEFYETLKNRDKVYAAYDTQIALLEKENQLNESFQASEEARREKQDFLKGQVDKLNAIRQRESQRDNLNNRLGGAFEEGMASQQMLGCR